jgi:hypothetical protein
MVVVDGPQRDAPSGELLGATRVADQRGQTRRRSTTEELVDDGAPELAGCAGDRDGFGCGVPLRSAGMGIQRLYVFSFGG